MHVLFLSFTVLLECPHKKSSKKDYVAVVMSSFSNLDVRHCGHELIQ